MPDDLFGARPGARTAATDAARDLAALTKARASAAEVAVDVLGLDVLDPRPDHRGRLSLACPGFADADMPCGGDCPAAYEPHRRRCVLLASTEGAAAACGCGHWQGDSIGLVQVVRQVSFRAACALIGAAFPGAARDGATADLFGGGR